MIRREQHLQPMRPLTGLVVLDEIQMQPQFVPWLRVLADRPESLALNHLYVLCHAPDQAGPWPLAEGITAVPLHARASVVT